jgi:hypothetical protein
MPERDRDDLVPALDRDVRSGRLGHVDAGAVRQDVDAAVALEDRLCRPRHLGLFRHVERDHLGAAGRPELFLAGKQGLPASPGDHHVRAGARELDPAGEPDTGPAAGDPGDLIF